MLIQFTLNYKKINLNGLKYFFFVTLRFLSLYFIPYCHESWVLFVLFFAISILIFIIKKSKSGTHYLKKYDFDFT